MMHSVKVSKRRSPFILGGLDRSTTRRRAGGRSNNDWDDLPDSHDIDDLASRDPNVDSDDDNENDNADEDYYDEDGTNTESMFSEVTRPGSSIFENSNQKPPSLLLVKKTGGKQNKKDNNKRTTLCCGWTARRFWNVLGQKVQKGSLEVLPPVLDEYFYEDTYNDQPWNWTFGTKEDDGVWMNYTDRAGTLMAATVWILILYSAITMLILYQSGHVKLVWAASYATIATMALACHAKTTFTDPGAVCRNAVPLKTRGVRFHPMCSICQCYKPAFAHHCRICNRCITRMDHHCPWMNNCVGAANLKHFTLFLFYTWTGCAMALIIFMVNYFFCHSESCEFSHVEIHLVRIMTVICTATWSFVSSMLMGVTFGILTGIGTIDRLKKKAMGTWHLSDEEPIPWTHVVGSAPAWTWFLPIDPFFPDYDAVMGYSTMERLLRERDMLQRLSSKRKDQQGEP